MSSVGADVTPTGWTSSRTALLVAHYQAGLSAAESARRIGAVSKNAVISKRRRLGQVAMADVGRIAGACWADDARQRPRFGAGRVPLFRMPPPMPTEPLPRMDGPPPPGASPRRLTERRFGECVWPWVRRRSPARIRRCSAALRPRSALPTAGRTPPWLIGTGLDGPSAWPWDWRPIATSL
jgi:hypothetical protein